MLAKPTTRIISVVEIRRFIGDVFEFGSTPRNWPTWHPTATSVSGAVDRPIQEGDRILEQDRFSFLVGCIRWKVGRVVPPSTWTIEGLVDEVPIFRGTTTTITYTLKPVPGGTRLERDMTYSVPSTLARFLDWLHFKQHNTRQSQRAVEQMKQLLESPTGAI